MKKIIILVAVVMVVIVGIILLKHSKNINPVNQPGNQSNEKAGEVGDDFKQEAQITIGKGGFVPSTIKVKKDTRVYWKNEAGNALDFQISPTVGGGLEKKDTAQGDEEFGTVGKIDTTGGYAYSFHKVGKFKYYNAQNPTENGEIEVVAEK